MKSNTTDFMAESADSPRKLVGNEEEQSHFSQQYKNIQKKSAGRYHDEDEARAMH